MKKFVIFSAGRGGDFGSCTIINEDIWNFLNEKNLSLLSESTINEIKSILDDVDYDFLINSFSFQQIHNFFSATNTLNCGKSFDNLTNLINYCVKNNIFIENDSFDD